MLWPGCPPYAHTPVPRRQTHAHTRKMQHPSHRHAEIDAPPINTLAIELCRSSNLKHPALAALLGLCHSPEALVFI